MKKESISCAPPFLFSNVVFDLHRFSSLTVGQELHGENVHDHSNCAHAVAAKRQKLRSEMKKAGKKLTLGDVTTLNITTLQAGVRVGDTYAFNCVPPTAKCTFDIRISPHVPPSEITSMLDTWCLECSSDADKGHKVTWSGNEQHGELAQEHALTSTDSSNQWWARFSSAITNMGIAVEPQVFPAATDSRFLRALGVKALGFSPMRRTEIMLHENDEYLEEDVFVEGIEVYVGLIEALGLAEDIDNGPPGMES